MKSEIKEKIEKIKMRLADDLSELFNETGILPETIKIKKLITTEKVKFDKTATFNKMYLRIKLKGIKF